MNQQVYPIKMQATKMFNDIDLFKRKDLSPHCDGSWKAPFEDEFNIEVKNDKARVYSNNPFAKKPSRFCNLNLVQQVPNSNMRIFQLTVNGKQVFFKIAHIIRK